MKVCSFQVKPPLRSTAQAVGRRVHTMPAHTHSHIHHACTHTLTHTPWHHPCSLLTRLMSLFTSNDHKHWLMGSACSK